jgi:chromosome segregation ATPase
MKSRPVFDLPKNHSLFRLTFALMLTALLAIPASAQQPATGRKRIPSLTTDDVVRPKTEQPTEAKPVALKSDEPDTAAPAKSGETKTSTEEASWRERVSKARDRAKELERTAEQAELRITSLRNDLGVSGQSARYRNDVAAEIQQTGQRLSDLRAQSRAAAEDLTQLLDYGKEKGFKEAEGPKATSDEGKPNEEFYRAQLAKLNDGIDSAQRRTQLYQNRLNDISQRILMNGGKKGGDNFYMLQLQKDREEAQMKLDESQAALAKAQTDLDALKEQARRAGVSPDLFR